MTRAGRRIAKSGLTPIKSALEWFQPRARCPLSMTRTEVDKVCLRALDVVVSLQRGELSETFAASLHLTAIRPGRVEWKYKERERDVRT